MRHPKLQLWSASQCVCRHPYYSSVRRCKRFREGNYGTANVDGRTSNAVCSLGRQRKWAITCVGNRGRHRFGQKPGRAGIPWDGWKGLAIFRSRSLLAAPVSPNNTIISRLNAGMSGFATSYQPVIGRRLCPPRFLRHCKCQFGVKAMRSACAH